MRGSDATRELKEHMKWGPMDVAVVKRLLDDNLQDYVDSAVIWAIQEEELEVLRLMCASWIVILAGRSCNMQHLYAGLRVPYVCLNWDLRSARVIASEW